MRRLQKSMVFGLVIGVLMLASMPGRTELEPEPAGHTLGDQAYPGAARDPFRQRERLRDSERSRNRNIYRYWEEEEARGAEEQRPPREPDERASTAPEEPPTQ